GGQIGGQIQLTNRQSEIIKLIKKDNKISRNMISTILGINESAIQKHLNTLKERGILKRVDGTRGYWEVILRQAQEPESVR
ncbi:MAG: HTH domain-containing protein, partial [Spirochaetales bacterium]|nr:HTH domain-containing protein [Spirochaetales bacterium]